MSTTDNQPRNAPGYEGQIQLVAGSITAAAGALVMLGIGAGVSFSLLRNSPEATLTGVSLAAILAGITFAFTKPEAALKDYSKRAAVGLVLVVILVALTWYLDGTTGGQAPSGGGGGTSWKPTWIDLRDEGGQTGPCDATKAAANDAAFNSAQTKLQPRGADTEVGGKIYLARGSWCFAHTLKVKNKTTVEGDGRNATEINAIAGFNDSVTNVASGASVNRLVELGDGIANQSNFCFGCRVENLTIDANGVAGLVPLYSQQANELSGAFRVLVSDFTDKGIWFAPGTSIVQIDTAEVYGRAGSGVNGLIRLESWGENRANAITANARSPVAAGSSGVWVNAAQYELSMIHMEQVETGVKVTNGDVVLNSATGHPSVTRVASYDSQSNGVVLDATPTGSPTTLVDSTTGGQTRSSVVALYEVSTARPNVTGSRTDGTALTSLLNALKTKGMVQDSTTP
jgi:hypothetical protein